MTKEALLQPEQTAPVQQGWKLVPVEPTPEMRKAASDAWLDCGSKLFLNKASASVKAGINAAPQPEQRSANEHLEPVAWMSDEIEDCDGDAVHDFSSYQDNHCKNPLYTTPPQRTAAEGEDTKAWVGLSVFEINDLVENTEYEDYRSLVERTEAKLKAKNERLEKNT